MDCGTPQARAAICTSSDSLAACKCVSRWILATSTGFCSLMGRVFQNLLRVVSNRLRDVSQPSTPPWSVGESHWPVVTPLISRTQTRNAKLQGSPVLTPTLASRTTGRANLSDHKQLRAAPGQPAQAPKRPERPEPPVPWTTASAPRRSSRRATSGASRRTSPRSGGTRAGTS